MTAALSDFDQVLERRRDRELAVRRERIREWQPEIDAEDRAQQQREAARRLIAEQRSFAGRQHEAAAQIRARRETTPAPKAHAEISKKKNEQGQESKKSMAMMIAGMSGGLKSMLRVGVAGAVAKLTGQKDNEGDIALAAAAAEVMKTKREKEEQQLEVAEKKKNEFVRRTMTIDADPSHRRPGMKMTQAPRPARD